MSLRRGIAVTAACALASAVLAVVPDAARAPASADPPTGGTTIVDETFTGSSVADPAWTVRGDTCLTGARTAPPAGAAQIPTCAAHRSGPVPALGTTPGYLQLTDTTTQRAGSVLYNRPIPAVAGVTITFDQYQYGGTGADGIGFFLVDGATDLVRTGGAGGSLGYAQRTPASGGDDEPGVVGGVLGVGLDAYGNYYDDAESRGAGCPEDERSPSTAEGAVAPNVITLRGPGDGMTGYCYLASTTPADAEDPNDPGTTLNGGTGTLRARTLAASRRQVNITVTPAPDPRIIVQVRYNPDDPDDPWITELDVPAPPDLPSTYKFGFSGSTGGVTDVHLIRNAIVRSVNPLAQLQLEKQVDRSAGALPAVITPGTVIPYQYTVTNAGTETLSALAIADDTITGPITCDATTLTPAPAVGSTTVCRGTYTVTAADADAGEVVNIATATARNPAEDEVTSPEATVTVPLVSRLELAKSVQTPPPYTAGQQVEYQYTVTNTGGSTVTNIAVADDRVSSGDLVCETNVLAPGASTTCTGTDIVDTSEADATGGIVNTAVATGETPIGQPVESPEAQAVIGINTDIAVTKTVDDPEPAVGDTVTFTVTATNNGPAVATDVVITDLLPAGRLTLESATTGGPQPSTYTAASGVWSIPTLAVDNAVTLTLTARVDTNGVVSNTASLTRLTQLDTNAANNSDTVSLNPASLDLALTKEVVGLQEVAAGEPVTFRVTVTNLGPRPGTGITVSEELPPGLTYQAAASGGDGSYDPDTGTWTIGSLAVGGTATYDFVLGTSDPGTFTNVASIATVSPTDINSANDSASASVGVRTPVADLVIVKGVDSPESVVGDTVTYTVTVLNRGPDPVRDVYVTDTGPEGVTVLDSVPSQGTVDVPGGRWEVGTLGSGRSAVLTVTARLDTTGTKTNLVKVDAPLLDDPTPEDNESTATVTTLAPAVDVSVTKSVAAAEGGPASQIPVGQDAVFTITATNNAVSGQPATTVTNAVFADVFDDGLTFVSASGDGTFDPDTASWSVGSIPVGTTVTLTIRATGTVVGQQNNAHSLVNLDQRDVDETNNSDSAAATFVELADLEVTKSVAPEVAQPGDTVEYTITVTNTGPNDTDDTVVNDPALEPAEITGHTTDNGTFDEETRTWTIPTLASGETATLTVSVLVSDAASGHYRNLVVIQESRVEDPEPDDNTATTELFVPAADIAVRKSVDDRTPVVGDTVTFTVGVRNLGPDAAEDVTVTDRLPAGLSYLRSRATVGTYDPATGTWDIGRLDPVDLPTAGDQAVLRITARVTRPGRLTNTATSDRSDAVPYDPDLTNNTDSASVGGAELGEPVIRTRTSAGRVRPGKPFHDRVRVTGLARGTTVPATARLYGPFASRAAARCVPARLARTVDWRARAGWTRTPAVRVTAPGVYTWRVTTEPTAANEGASTRCGLASETTTVAKPRYRPPVVDGGFSGTVPSPRAVRTVVRAPGIGLDATVVPTTVARGHMVLPADVSRTGWLKKSAGYGDKIGATVVAGHVSDRQDRPGALWGLRRAERGQSVSVVSGGRTYRYRVSETATYDRTRRLPRRFFGTTGANRLVLISCTGRVRYANGHFHYTKYQVVVARARP
ncbi:DUF7507 domain-containing protein [Nocardioides dongkuii]|uniref:DUF7507 domain-containing protein n=1 Tax=Nocardioides dongkuii TaxID=2760089 RepID=UPI0018786A8C|nr:sortase [Nocardioides dongkuii]